MTSGTLDDTVASPPSQKKLPGSALSILDNVRNQFFDTLTKLMRTLFDQIDDTFFDLADTAHSNNEQNRHFDALREIRLQRKKVEQTFFSLLENSFRQLSSLQNPEDATDCTQADNKALNALELLDQEDAEIDIAISSMVSRARREYPSLLLQTHTRLSDALKPSRISEDNNPVDPQQVVQSFITACGHFQLELQSRLIFFKQFDRLVLRRYEKVLLDTNQILIAAGILPNLRSIIRRTPVHSTQTNNNEKRQQEQHANFIADSTNTHASSATCSTAASDNAFLVLQNLLAARNNLQTPSVYINNPGNAAELLDQQQRAPGKLDKVDINIIHIVDMIFEYILTQDLPAPMSLLIGRLQIPVLKIAIKDKARFNTNRHPARRLVNLIGHSCLGWDHHTEPESDPLYIQVETVVRHILDNYSGNISNDMELFAEAESTLLSHIKKTEQRAMMMERRLIAAEEGKAKTEQARLLIRQLIRDRIQGKKLPPVVIEFIKIHWQRLLLQILLKEGKSSDSWSNALTMADNLMWSVLPLKNERARERWLKIVPILLKAMKEGLDDIACNPSETDRMMSELWAIHSKMLAWQGEDSPCRTVKVDLTDQEPSPTAIRSQQAQSRIAQRKAAIDQATSNSLMQQIAHFKTGSWFEFTGNSEKALRCKLSTKIRATDSYVFVNRMGIKTKQLTQDELVIALHDKHIRALHSGPVIDRALESITTRLKASLP